MLNQVDHIIWIPNLHYILNTNIIVYVKLLLHTRNGAAVQVHHCSTRYLIPLNSVFMPITSDRQEPTQP